MVVFARDVDVAEVSLGKPESRDRVTSISVHYRDAPLVLQTPRLGARPTEDGQVELSLEDGERAGVASFVALLDGIVERAAGEHRLVACPLGRTLRLRSPDASQVDGRGRVTAILRCAGLWVAAGHVGLSLQVLSLRVDPPVTFLDDADEF
jgi:hypothetical protein